MSKEKYVQIYKNNVGRKHLLRVETYLDDELHSFADKPSVICYFKSGLPRRIEYHIHGDLGRVDGGPSMIYYMENGNILEEMSFKDGKKHGSSFMYDENGGIKREIVFNEGTIVEFRAKKYQAQDT
jgi:antitoxin component YwqK of YwqJK toxin-antitoxin module